jgi:hypothetical protein
MFSTGFTHGGDGAPCSFPALLGAGKLCIKYASTRKDKQEIKSRKIKIKNPGGI